MDISLWANLSAIIGVPIAFIGLIITYLTLRHQIRQSDKKIGTLNEIMNLQNKYQSQGAQYHNCSFYSSSFDAKQIEQEYQKGINEVREK